MDEGRKGMKFRAIAIGVMRDGHPLQTYSAQESTVLKWADQTAKEEKCEVDVFILEERLIKKVLANQHG